MALNQFISLISSGSFARKNNYEVSIKPPNSMTLSGLKKGHLNMRCESITLPGMNVSSSNDDIRIGPGREHVFNVTFNPVTAVFLCSDYLTEKGFFEEWQSLSFDTESFAIGYYKNYIGSILIKQKNDKNQVTYTAELLEVFPKSVSALEFATDAQDLQKLSVEFAYRRWIKK